MSWRYKLLVIGGLAVLAWAVLLTLAAELAG